jgi:hypothetical protein
MSREERAFLYELTRLQHRYFDLVQWSTIVLSVVLSLLSVLGAGIVLRELDLRDFGLMFFSKLGAVGFAGFVVIVGVLTYRDREKEKLAQLAEEIKRKYIW